MRAFNVINLSKKHPGFILFLVSVFVAYSIGKFIINNDPIETQLIIITLLLLVVTFRWNIFLIPILFLSYSGYFGNFQNMPRLPILVVPGGLTFYEVLIFFYLFYFFFIKKSNILRTPIAKAILLLFISAIVSVIVTHFEYGSDLRSLLMNQRAIFLYLTFFIFIGVMKNDVFFYKLNYLILSLAAVFILMNLLNNLFPRIQEFRIIPIGGESSYEKLTKIEDFGARRFLLPIDGIVYYGLSFFFFMVALKPFGNKHRVFAYIFSTIAFVVLVLSFTRGLWICIPMSIIVVLLYITLTLKKYEIKSFSLFIFAGILFIASAAFLSAYPDYFNAISIRLSQTKVALFQVSGNWESRLLEARAALDVIYNNPIFGGGNFIVRRYGPTLLPGLHFGFLDIYINYGLSGFITFLLFFYIPIKQFAQNVRKIANGIDFWIATSSICYIGIFMSVSFYSSQFFHQCWILSFCFCLANLAFLDRKYRNSRKVSETYNNAKFANTDFVPLKR